MSLGLKGKKIIGTLAPLSALVSRNNENNGTFGAGLVFLDWLHRTGQNAWQLLPLHETQLEFGSTTKHVPSPYKTYGIGLDPKYTAPSFINKIPTQKEKERFALNNKYWIDDYALFCALRDHFGTDDWRKWEKNLRDRNETVLSFWSEKLKRKIDYYILLQWRAHESYKLLKEKAEKLGIILIGDLPFYLSLQSPLVWVYKDIFKIEREGELRFVSGIPNSVITYFGRQVWGHPLYNWRKMEKVLDFWKIRLRYQRSLYHLVRLDHAKGFFDYGVLDLKNDRNDEYLKGPGEKVFSEIVSFCKSLKLSLFVEDSGERLRGLRECSRKLKVPGIKIFRYALDEKKKKINKEYTQIWRYPKSSICYSTTHDTESLMGYLKKLNIKQKETLAEVSSVEYSPIDKEFAKNIRECLILCPSKIVIIPIQDWLLTEDRINVPGTEVEVNDPNWRYKIGATIESL